MRSTDDVPINITQAGRVPCQELIHGHVIAEPLVVVGLTTRITLSFSADIALKIREPLRNKQQDYPQNKDCTAADQFEPSPLSLL